MGSCLGLNPLPCKTPFPSKFAPFPSRFSPFPFRFSPFPSRFAPFPSRFAPRPFRFAPFPTKGTSWVCAFPPCHHMRNLEAINPYNTSPRVEQEGGSAGQ